jgi:hypothetical protein
MMNSIKIICIIFITACLIQVFPSSSSAVNLNTPTSKQVTPLTGEKFYMHDPNTTVNLRKGPSAKSIKLEIIGESNGSLYVYKKYNNEWLEVYERDGTKIGYAHTKAFKAIQYLQDKIKTKNGIYEITYHGYIDPPYYSKKSSNYYYTVTKGDKILLEIGNTNFPVPFRSPILNEPERTVTNLHSLSIQGRKIGWLFGWDKFGGEHYDLDFSFARILIPDSTIDGNERKYSELWTETFSGIKFSISDFLVKKENQLLIVPTSSDNNSPFWWGAVTGYYYFPYEVRFTLNNVGVTILKRNKVTLNQLFVESDPSYAYGIAFLMNDHNFMKIASNYFLHKMEAVSNKCGEYDRDLEKFSSKKTIDLEKFWEWSLLQNPLEGLPPHRPSIHDVANCIKEAAGSDFVWHFFKRTGLFPSRKTINAYIESKHIRPN